VACGQQRKHDGNGRCGRCWQHDPLRPIRQAERIAQQLDTAPEWLAAFAVFISDRHAIPRACQQLSALRRLLLANPGAGNQTLLELARTPGRSMGTLTRSLQDFLVPQGLALPLDQGARLAAGRRDRRIEAIPESMRPAVARYLHDELAAQIRARRAGTRPRAEHTIEANLAILRDLARFLHQHSITDWALVGTAPIESFLNQRPADAARILSVARRFFRWTRHHHLTLADPTRGIQRQRVRAFQGVTLTRVQQRQMMRRWTDPNQGHPHERLVGLLALLHAASQAELRALRLDDIDHGTRRIRLGHRPHPVPLDPVSWAALQASLDHHTALATANPHLIVTRATRARQTPASTAYLCHVLDDTDISIRTLRATRITDLITALDPKVVAVALGMDPEGVLTYLRDDVDTVRLPANT
jgi:site-specific recombinase XerD